MNRVDRYIERVEHAIFRADIEKKTKLPMEVFGISGMSGVKNRIFLNELVKPDTRYLEIGVWRGSTFISALYDNTYDVAFAIDNFSEFQNVPIFGEKVSDTFSYTTLDASGPNNVEVMFKENCEKAKDGLGEFTFINSDCFALPADKLLSIKNINTYLFDGGHTEEDHIQALTYYYPCLSDVFILVVDDWNHHPVRKGTYEGFLQTNLKVHKQWIMKSEGNSEKYGWWNGYYMAVCEKRTGV